MVYIKPDQKPDAIMLSWHDGKDWEHRAFWGDDKFTEGTAGTPVAAARWARSRRPASGSGWRSRPRPSTSKARRSRGWGSRSSAASAIWHRAGAVPPSHVEQQELYVAETFPVESAGQGKWSGRFPLDRDSLYRVELRNELGHPSKPMKPGKVVAIPDNPPQVVLERPGTDLVLNEPAKVPLSISAYDDFGLADIVVSVQRGDSGGFVGRPVKHYDTPAAERERRWRRLDLPAMDLKTGEHVRYRVEARDRKGQSAQTQEYVVRIAADNNAADKQLESFDKSQDTFRENLVKLIAEQAKVRGDGQGDGREVRARSKRRSKAAEAEAEAPPPTRRPSPTTRPRPPSRPSSTPSWPSSSTSCARNWPRPPRRRSRTRSSASRSPRA